MMVEGSLVTLGLFCWLFLRAARQTEERQELVEYARAHGVELTPERAGRAVAAGAERSCASGSAATARPERGAPMGARRVVACSSPAGA